jgi:hypothetical protein
VTGAAAGAELEVLTDAEPEVLAGAPTEVAADVTGATAEVSRVVADVTRVAAGVTGAAAGAELADAEVAAWAWRENTSKMTRIPAAKIAACIAR